MKIQPATLKSIAFALARHADTVHIIVIGQKLYGPRAAILVPIIREDEGTKKIVAINAHDPYGNLLKEPDDAETIYADNHIETLDPLLGNIDTRLDHIPSPEMLGALRDYLSNLDNQETKHRT